MEFAPAAAAGAALGPAPAAVAAVPAARAVAGTIQSAKGETHTAILSLFQAGFFERELDSSAQRRSSW